MHEKATLLHAFHISFNSYAISYVEELPDTTFEDAACLAAYYSKGKGQKKSGNTPLKRL